MTAGAERIDTCTIRVVAIYATHWRYRGQLLELKDQLELGRLSPYYDVYKDQLPHLLPDTGPRSGAAALETEVDGLTLGPTSVRMFALPSNQVVIAVEQIFEAARLRSQADAAPVDAALDQCIRAQVTIGGRSLESFVDGLALPGLSVDNADGDDSGKALLPERHLLVFVGRPPGDPAAPVPGRGVVEMIVYRDEPPYREEFTAMRAPAQLNLLDPFADSAEVDDRVTLGFVTPYVSFIYGHERVVEDSVFLSAVQAVGTAARFRQIWLEAYRHVSLFRNERQRQTAGDQKRDDLEELADRLGNLEFDLTFSVEFPLMRIESFHSALYEAMDLPVQAQALSQMFTQLGGSLRSEITAIDIRDRRRDDQRQKWNSVAAGILSLVGVSVGFVVAFLGINAREVMGTRSMFAPAYQTLYLIAASFALVPVSLILFPYLRDWARGWRAWGSMRRGVAVATAGVLLFIIAAVEDAEGPASARVIDGLVKAFAGFIIVMGTALAGFGIRALAADWHKRRRDD